MAAGDDAPLFVPSYRPLRSGEWEIRIIGLGVMPGYWTGPAQVRDVAALVRSGKSWMTITPFEIESQETGLRSAIGHVLIFGLGLGWAAAACACRAGVTAVTIVEKDPDVIALHRELDLFAQLPAEARDKLRILQGDALDYQSEAPVDLLMPDIWQPLINDDRLDEVRAMQANVDAAAIYFWGQEMEIARHAVAAGRALDEAGVAATIADFALPLIGARYPGYAERLAAAARRWMNGRWLPGTAPPWTD